jgi:hypothetical protein
VIANDEFQITYLIRNVGSATAKSVSVSDRYDPNLFIGVDNVHQNGSVNFMIDQLDIGSEKKYIVSVTPKVHGIYESTRARVKYDSFTDLDETEEPDEDESQIETLYGFSSSLGRVRIQSREEFLRKSSSHYFLWISFFIAALSTSLVPMYIMISQK